MYSNPMVQRPVSTNVINQGTDTNVDPYTGQEKFADGGGVTASGGIDFHVPIDLGGNNGVSGYGSQQSTLSTGSGAPSQVPTAIAQAQQQQQAPQYYFAHGGNVQGGIMSNLGSYSDGGRLLKGPGDGVSDSIPASIGNRQPARLADGEFVVPARIVSELGNGSTEAGARKLYAMMERVQKQRGKTVGKGKVAVNSKADKHLPA